MAKDNSRKIRRKVRSAYIVSTVSIALVLFLLGAVGYLILGAMNASNRLRESVSVYVMLKNSVGSDTTRQQLQRRFEGQPHVKQVRYISKAEAAEEFKSYLGTDFVAFLDENPLPDSYELKLDATADQRVMAALEKTFNSWSEVDEVVYQRNLVDQIATNINKFNMVLLFFGGALLAISLILLNNTIRVMIFSRRYIINTMKLVGATRWFIMRPFLGRSVLQGFYAGLISWVMLVLMIAGLREGLPDVQFVSEQMHLIAIFVAMMAGGILISLLFTAFAVRKFLRMRDGAIYFY